MSPARKKRPAEDTNGMSDVDQHGGCDSALVLYGSDYSPRNGDRAVTSTIDQDRKDCQHCFECAEKFLLQGQLPDFSEQKGSSRGEWKVEIEKMEHCLLVLQKGGRLNEETQRGLTLLQLATLVGNKDVIRKLAECGADLNHECNERTALALAVWSFSDWDLEPELRELLKEPLSVDRREDLVALLLGLGADPDLKWYGETLDQTEDASFSMRYNFERARLPEVRTWFGKEAEKRMQQMAEKAGLPKLPNIRELPFSLVGQHWAVTSLISAVRDWAFDLPSKPDSACLALMFAGPSGHGKTELARMLSKVLCRSDDDFHQVDCASLRTASEIFGMGGAYQGAKQGSTLNNWMTQHEDRIGVVIFDELEKAEKDVRTQLLNILDKGEFQDKQLTESSQSKRVNCRKILWIFTTNAFDHRIMEETKGWEKSSARVEKKQKLHLENRLRKEMQQAFEVCFAGRVKRLITFVPFCAPEKTPTCILDDETRVLIDSKLSRELAHFQDEKRNHHDRISVDFHSAKDRQEFLDLLRAQYLREEGARCVERLLQIFLRSKVIDRWHLKKVRSDKHQLRVRVNLQESEVEVDMELRAEMAIMNYSAGGA